MTVASAALELFFVLCLLGAVGALCAPTRVNARLLAIIASLAAFSLLILGAVVLLTGSSLRIELWSVLSLGTLTLGIDRLSALFLFVTGLVFLAVSLFSGRYLRKYEQHHSLRYFGVLYHCLFASVVLVLVGADAVSFLVGWEGMSILSYLLVTYEERDESSDAGYVMLAMSEAGTLAVVLAFVLAAAHGGTLDFVGLRMSAATLGETARWVMFLLCFFGFAVKAGLIPVNSWLPLAHPVAPTNVSALLSAVIVNLGMYGIIRFNLDLVPAPGPGAGLLILIVGSISALIGILYATIQSEMKRLLAHSTIENMGIVAAGVGASLVFQASGQSVAASIALIAGLYHLTNHSVYKAMLFIETGLVEASTGTRDLDRLGGLARRMPWTSGFVLVAVLAIAALPPLNGFVSEWLTLQTILRSVLLFSTGEKMVFAIAGALLALTAGLAVTCFAKFFAMGFLGMPRSDAAANATEAPRSTRWPLGLLAAACICLGLLPTYVIPVLDGAASPLAHASAATALVPPFFEARVQQQEHLPATFVADFHDLGAQIGHGLLPGRGLVVLHRGGESNPVVFAMSTTYMFVVLALLLLAIRIVFRLLTRRRAVMRSIVWDGGLRRLWPGMTYTATGFSNPVRVVFQAVLRPTTVEDSTEAVATHFRTAIRRERAETPVLDRVVLEPPVRALRRAANAVRKMHVGNVNAYAAYVLIALLIVLIVGLELLK